MNRKALPGGESTAATGIAALPFSRRTENRPSTQRSRWYTIEIEVVEGMKCRCHKVGDRFSYPDDMHRICPWLWDSMSGIIHSLELGETLPWRYKGTPYEKVIDPLRVTTEFVRCPDPTEAGIVVKITRKLRAS